MIKDSHQRSERMHAKIRAEERFGMDLNHEAYRTLRGLFMGNTVPGKGGVLACLQKGPKKRVYRVHWEGRVFRLVWDKPRRTIVTLLPQDAEDLAIEAQIRGDVPAGTDLQAK